MGKRAGLQVWCAVRGGSIDSKPGDVVVSGRKRAAKNPRTAGAVARCCQSLKGQDE